MRKWVWQAFHQAKDKTALVFDIKPKENIKRSAQENHLFHIQNCVLIRACYNIKQTNA